jgi:preprotein translocase subunit SecG
MIQILLAIHLIICVALIGAILLQRSEGGGALGMGGGPSGVMSGRGAANFMTRVTSVLGGVFFLTSIGLTLMAGQTQRAPGSIMEDGGSVDGVPTKSIDLSRPAAPAANAVAPAPVDPGGIPASSAAPVAPSPFGGDPLAPPAPAPAAPAPAPAEEKK